MSAEISPNQGHTAPPELNPLRAEHCAACKRVLEKAPQVLELIEACKECGLEFPEEEADVRAALATAQAIAQKFFGVSQ